MLSFFRLLAAFLLGGAAGAAAVLFMQPTFSIVVTNAPAGVTTLVDAHPPVVDEPEFVPPPSPVPAPAAGAPASPVSAAPAPPPPAAPAPAPIDYVQAAGRPAFWPAEVQAVVPSVITFSEDGKRTEEMRIAVGTALQLSGVQPDGTLELRAQGRKFTLHAKFTDFDVLVRKKAQELIVVASSGGAPPSAAPAVAAPPPVAAPTVPVKPKGPLTLQEKLDALYGRTKEEPAPAPSPAAPSAAPAAPAPMPAATPSSPAPVAPAPAAPAEPSGKDADLKRRMDGLFKPANGPAR